MICLRCGYCCKIYAVVIIDDPAKGLVDDNLIGYLGDSRCKHLVGDEPGSYSCGVHNYPWFKETPCAAFGQVEASPLDECRIGRYMIDKAKSESGT